MKLKMKKIEPTISIGLPVYNGENTLSFVLDALLAQTFENFEIIISDNCSTDNTENICTAYAYKDTRIRYIKQPVNLGMDGNFKFVLSEAVGRYFMWSAADDLRSTNFLEENFNFLENNKKFVASTSPNIFEERKGITTKLINFSIEGNLDQRIDSFIENCWQSHGIFYSLIRTVTLKIYPYHREDCLAADWKINMYLLSQGNIHRTEKGLMTSGAFGVSSSSNPWQPYRTHLINWILPLYKFSCYTLHLASQERLSWRLKLIIKLLKLNFSAMFDQAIAELYIIYTTHIRHYIRK